MIKHIVAMAGLLICMLAPSYAAKDPRPLARDGRIKQVVYDPNQIVELVGTYGYVTTIEFATDEVVKEKKLGDSIAWQTLINGSYLYIKPVEPDASGNLVVITNKRSYYFKLKSSNTDMTYLIRFKYTDSFSGSDSNNAANRANLHTGAALNPEKINLNYAFAGKSLAIQLKNVFDDGEFTYFKFDPQIDLPSIYLVESDGTESIVNVRREGTYLVVERTGHMFTLRNGKAHLCVENLELKKGAV